MSSARGTVCRVWYALGFAAAAAALWGCLVAIGMSSWHRTATIRGGTAGPGSSRVGPGATGTAPEVAPVRVRTSVSTLLPALCGFALAFAGILLVSGHRGRGLPPAGPGLVLAGAAVAWAGLVARVTGLEADGEGMTIRYRARSEVMLAWACLVSLDPPRWPLGGWTVRARASGSRRSYRRVLMPSDLLGAERILAMAVEQAALRFDGRAWVRPLEPIGASADPEASRRGDAVT